MPRSVFPVICLVGFLCLLLNYVHVCLKKTGKPCIVAFDELQQISKYPEKNTEALLRSHIQYLSNVHFIFSDSEYHLVTKMFLSSAHPFYNDISVLGLYPIVVEEYIPFVCHWLDIYEWTIHEEDILIIYRLFKGNTYYIQKIFHEAFINTPIGSSCTLNVLRQTIGGALKRADDGYHQLLSGIPERQRELLYAIASVGETEKIMSAGFIREYSLVSSSAVQAATHKLMKLDLLTEEDNIYFIPDIPFHMYLQRLENTNIIFIPS